jgi:hypothetical protein
MPLKQKFAVARGRVDPEEEQKWLYRRFGVVDNPFFYAIYRTGHPRMPLSQDDELDEAVMEFYGTRHSQAIAITASQGIGKTNLLNAYAHDLQEVLRPQGFFVIRYMADPESSFDPLVRSLFEMFDEHDLLRLSIKALADKLEDGEDLEDWLDSLRMPEMKALIRALVETQSNAQQSAEDQLKERLKLAHQWLLGFPVRKLHQEELGVHFRLDTVESKTRALRDMVYFSASMKTLEGIFLLMDELEKQGSTLSKTGVLQYLSALRALIDALPKYLFLMVALTPDALQRYREMLPALKGRLARSIELPPLQDEEQALRLMRFYWQEGRNRGAIATKAKPEWGDAGDRVLVSDADARALFQGLLKQSTIKGIRQREFLNGLAEKAGKVMNAMGNQ